MNRESKILVVEDEPVLRFLTAKQLSQLGLVSEAAHDGFQAISMTRQNTYDLILMDIGLPGIDGIKVAEQIRKDELAEGKNRTTIVALTAYAKEEQCREVGMDDFMLKPLMLDGLKQILCKWNVLV
ncbi:MAG: response regulator [Candidatus Obscuribacterales bacterium]|nr:response regulator [Candidatus Obscuribacterales bacterium]